MKRLLLSLLAAFLAVAGARAQTAVTLPIAASSVADIGNGPIKVRVTQGNVSIFTMQGSGVGSTPGASTNLTLTAVPAAAVAPKVGAIISGNGITSGTTVAAYNGVTTVTLSAAMSVPASTAVAWGASCPASAAGIPTQFIPASAMADYFVLYTQARICAISPGGPANSLLIMPVFYDSTTPGGGGGSGAVSSVFSRIGAVAAQAGDYVIAQITNGLSNVLNSGQIFVGSAGNIATGVAMSRDCTIDNAGAITCTKTNNVAFATSATTDTTNATNISSGTLNTLRLPSPFTSGTRQGNTSAFQTFAGAAPTNGHVATFDANGNVQDGGVAGAGTVTSVACGGVTITASGTCPEPFAPQNFSLAASTNGTVLTVTVNDASGATPTAASPIRIPFRSATAATGTITYDTVATGLTINTFAAGASLGCANSTACRLWVVAFDNAGTAVLSLFNASNTAQCFPINEGVVQSSTAMTGAATSAGVFYTPNGTTLASKAVRILGYVEYNASGLATAGTYATGPNFIQAFGGSITPPCRPTGNTVQFTVTNSATTSTSITMAASTLAQAITPTSAANRINVISFGSLECSATAAFSAKLAILRAGVAVSPNEFIYCGGAGAINIAASTIIYTDAPNTTSSTTYSAGIASSVAGQTTLFPAAGPDNSSGGAILITEIMG